MHLVCPHCHSPVEVAGLDTSAEVACPSCGSSFTLERGETTVTEAEAARTIGRFEVLAVLGQGAFGTVYKARDPELDRVVALKVPRAGSVGGPRERDRFLREARSAAQLRHPNIVAVHEVGTADGLPYLVSDFVEGVPLSDLLSAKRLSFREAAELIATVADALHYAHERGVVHRDVKPSNVMIDRAGTPHVMDFGLARREAGEVTMTLEGQILGTPAYMSPEQARGEGHRVDARADVYSLGVMLYQLLTGELPFRGTKRMLLHQVLTDEARPPRRLNDHIPRDLETVTLKAMAKELARRYGTAQELADDLRRWLGGEPIKARPAGRLERTARWVRRNPVASGLLAMTSLAALALVGLAVGYAYHARLSAAYDAEAGARQREQEQRKKAEGLADKAEAALGEARRSAYFHRILLADQAVKENRLPRAAVLLGETDEGLRDWEWRYLNAQSRPELLTLPMPRPLKADRLVAFSPDGRLLACPGEGNTVVVYDTVTGAPVVTLTGHTMPVRVVAFHPGGKQLASGSDDAARAWDLATGEQVWVYPHPSLSLAYIADGSRLATLGKQPPANKTGPRPPGNPSLPGKILDTATGWLIGGAEFGPGGSDHASVDLSPDGRHVISSSNSLAFVHDLATGGPPSTLRGHPNGVHGVAFGQGGKIAATGGGDGTVKLWDAATGGEIRTLAHEGVWCVAFSADGRYVASGGSDRTVRVWEVATGRVVRTLAGHDGRVVSVVFSPDGRRLGSAGDDGRVKVWDLAADRPMLLPVPAEPVRNLAFSPDSKSLVCKATRGEKLIWGYDSATGRLTWTRSVPEIASQALVGLDGKCLAEHWSGRGLRLHDMIGGRPTMLAAADALKPGVRSPPTTPVRAVASSPDGTQLASLLTDGSLKVWDVAAKKERYTVAAQPADRIAFSPDGRWLTAPGPAKGIATVWEVASGKVRVVLKGHAEAVTAVAFSVDGTRLVTASADQTLKVWDAATGAELASLRGHSGPVNDVAVHPAGRRFASVADDGTVKLWDLASGQEALSLPVGFPRAVAVAFSPDGRRLAVGTDGTVVLWDAPEDAAATRLARREALLAPEPAGAPKQQR